MAKKTQFTKPESQAIEIAMRVLQFLMGRHPTMPRAGLEAPINVASRRTGGQYPLHMYGVRCLELETVSCRFRDRRTIRVTFARKVTESGSETANGIYSLDILLPYHIGERDNARPVRETHLEGADLYKFLIGNGLATMYGLFLLKLEQYVEKKHSPIGHGPRVLSDRLVFVNGDCVVEERCMFGEDGILLWGLGIAYGTTTDGR